MNLSFQKRLAAKILRCSPSKIIIDPRYREQIKDAIKRDDIKYLIDRGIIRKKQDKGVSRARANQLMLKKKKKGQRSGPGSKKGKATARTPKKEAWMLKIRAQRKLLKELKEKSLIDNQTFNRLYRLAKGGFFRSKAHLKLYLKENHLYVKKK